MPIAVGAEALPVVTARTCLPYWLEAAGWLEAILSDATAAAMGRLPSAAIKREIPFALGALQVMFSMQCVEYGLGSAAHNMHHLSRASALTTASRAAWLHNRLLLDCIAHAGIVIRYTPCTHRGSLGSPHCTLSPCVQGA